MKRDGGLKLRTVWPTEQPQRLPSRALFALLLFVDVLLFLDFIGMQFGTHYAGFIIKHNFVVVVKSFDRDISKVARLVVKLDGKLLLPVFLVNVAEGVPNQLGIVIGADGNVRSIEKLSERLVIA